ILVAQVANLLMRLNRGTTLNSNQLGMDSIWEASTKELGSVTSLVPVMVGGAAFRLGRTGVMSMELAQTGKTALAVKAVSYASGFVAEISSYELTRRALLSASSPNSSQLWKWEGNEGIKNALLSSGITFGMLRA